MDSRHSPLAEPVLGLAEGKTRGLAHEVGNDELPLCSSQIANLCDWRKRPFRHLPERPSTSRIE